MKKRDAFALAFTLLFPGRRLAEARRALDGIAAILGAGCARDPGPPPPAPPALAVDFSGCAAVRVRRSDDVAVCEVPSQGPLSLWIHTAVDAVVQVDWGRGPVAALGTAIQGGLLVSSPPAAGATAVTVTAARGGATATFRLPLAGRLSTPDLDDAESLRQQGKLDEAEARLRGPLADPRPTVALLARRKLARIERARGRADAAIAIFEQVLSKDREVGRISDEIEDRLALAFTLLFPGRRLAEAGLALDGIAAIEAKDPQRRALTPYFRGWVAYEAGDLRAALQHFREAAEKQERLGLTAERAKVFEPWADVLALLGRHDEAIARIRQAEAALPPGTPPCRRAALLSNLGWTALRARGPLDPVGPISEAIALHRRHCKGPETLANYLTNLALAELERGRTSDARAHLDEARRTSPSPGPRIELWWLILEGKIALGLGRPEVALGWFERLESLGRRLLLPEASFTGALGRARSLDALGRAEPASAAYAEAEEQLDAWSRLVPLGEGRDTFLAGHEQSARLRVDFLLRSPGAHAATRAAAAARTSRSRLLAALGWIERVSALTDDARARWDAALGAYRREREALDAASAGDWKIPKDRLDRALAERAEAQQRLREALDRAVAELGAAAPRGAAPGAPPAEGELLLLIHPLPEGWAGFAIDARGTSARRLGALDVTASPEQLAAAILAPFDEAIARARRVRVAAYGPIERLDLHALPFHGQPLLAHAPVVYTADLPARGPHAVPRDPVAVMVSDPRGDLPAARAEAAAVGGALAQRGMRVERLELAAATHTAVRDALERPETWLFHYAGHGVFEGRDGWESALPLARGGWLTISDVAALPHAPAQVVLSGCETARTAASARAAGLGLAQAFLVAGAEVVVAATRPVDDRQSASILTRIHQDGDDLAVALQRAVLAERAAHPASDWASYRVLAR